MRGWRLNPRGNTPWLPDDRGHWVSDPLGISFAPQGPLLRVYDQDGSLMPLYAEAIDTIAARERALAEQDREIAALQAELRRLRGE